MKKSIFTAIAIMAFVGASLGNTKEVEKVYLEEKTLEIDACLAAAVAAYRGAVECLGEDAALTLAVDVQDACIEARG